VVFNVGGIKYRLVVAVKYSAKLVFIRFRMEQLDLDRKALEPSIGSRARVSEVLSGRRRLTLDMIRRLHRQLGIPADVLMGS
jgi:antitoxin component HigA of HigAB toxin-antitoxin module